jgi:hypothetical protein
MDDGGQVTRRLALALATLTLTCVAAAPAEPDDGFVHPGLLHDREDLARTTLDCYALAVVDRASARRRVPDICVQPARRQIARSREGR